MALTQTQLVTAVADRAELSRSDAKRALVALDQVVLEELANAQKVRIGGLVQSTVRVKPARKARKGRNPATGEEVTIAAKPASVDLRARPLARATGALPSVQKARAGCLTSHHVLLLDMRDRIRREPILGLPAGVLIACCGRGCRLVTR